jgi:ATP-dependent DNA helicase 2 subunit 2
MSWLEAEASAVRRKVKQVAKAKLDLEITPNMRIGVAVYIKTKLVSLPSLKKKESESGGAVRMDRSYVRMDDPDIVVEEKMLALRYGVEYVAVPPERVSQLRLADESKCMKVLGFIDKSLVGMQRLISGCDCIAAEPGNANAAIALSSLIHALVDQGKVALCRFAARDNSEPKLLVLFPHVEKDFECFYAVQAPFSEDSREATLLFAPLPKPRDELISALEDFVSNRTMHEPFSLELVINPTIHRYWRLVQERAKDGSAPVPVLDPEVYSLLHPEMIRFDEIACRKSLDRLLEVRPLIEAVINSEEEKKKRRFWREINQAELVRSPTKNIDIKKIRIEDGTGPSQISTQAESQTDAFGVRETILKGDMKNAIEKIQQYRESSIATRKPQEFNELLRGLLDLVEPHPRLWRELIVSGVMLISSDEVKESSVSWSEATQFFEDVMKRV